MFMALGWQRTACVLHSLNTETSSISPWTTRASMVPLITSVCTQWSSLMNVMTVLSSHLHALSILWCIYVVIFPVPLSSCAFITFEKMESADQAVAEVRIIPSKNIQNTDDAAYDPPAANFKTHQRKQDLIEIKGKPLRENMHQYSSMCSSTCTICGLEIR